jgi:hypothetical protein
MCTHKVLLRRTQFSLLFITALFAALTCLPSAKVFSNGLGTPKRAVLVAGPDKAFPDMSVIVLRSVANDLAARGVKVDTFFYEDCTWAKIKPVATGADIFIFCCHGYLDGTTTGILLADNYILKDYTIESELKLARNALVMSIGTCYAAGGSAGDNADIGINTALFRVAEFARPFFKCGAIGYFACNVGNVEQTFFRNFFSGMTMHECFVKGADAFGDVEVTKPCSINNKLEIGIGSRESGGNRIRYVTIDNGTPVREVVPNYKLYEVAYISYASYTIKDFFTE